MSDTGPYVLRPGFATSTSSISVTTTIGPTGGAVVGVTGTSGAVSRSTKNVESAVYAHIQAVRALGRRTINTVEISTALGLPQNIVDGTIEALKKKGIKVAG